MPTAGEKVRVDAHKRAQSSMKVSVNSYSRTFKPRGKNRQASSEEVKQKKRQSLGLSSKGVAKATGQRISEKIASGQ